MSIKVYYTCSNWTVKPYNCFLCTFLASDSFSLFVKQFNDSDERDNKKGSTRRFEEMQTWMLRPNCSQIGMPFANIQIQWNESDEGHKGALPPTTKCTKYLLILAHQMDHLLHLLTLTFFYYWLKYRIILYSVYDNFPITCC